jgi:CO dehydrogenase maturation factor
MDMLVVVVEPGKRSIDTAKRVRKLAGDIGLGKIKIVANKIRSEKDKEFLIENMADFEFLGFLPYSDQIIDFDLKEMPTVLGDSPISAEVERIAKGLGADS